MTRAWIAGACLLAATACSGDDADPTPTPSPSPAPQPTPTPSPSPSPGIPGLAESLELQVEGCRVLGSEETLALPLSLDSEVRAQLQLEASSWRQESAQLSLEMQGASIPAELHRAWAQLSAVGVVNPGAGEGYGSEHRPAPLLLTVGPETPLLTLRAAPGTSMEICGARLLPPDTVLPDPTLQGPELPPAPESTVEVAPCQEAGCDDAELLRELLAAHLDPVTLRLAAGRFTLRSSLRVTRGALRIEGATEGETELLWSPSEGGDDWGAALRFSGPGQQGEGFALAASVAAHRDSLLVTGTPALQAGDRVLLTADDFGDVPPLCVEGRDVERVLRHVRWIATITSTEVEGPDTRLTLDRHTSHDIPLAAIPVVRRVELLEGITLSRLQLLADCPAAIDTPPQPNGAVSCPNPAVLGHSAVRLDYTAGATVHEVHARAFGRFGVHVEHALDTRVLGGSAAFPADVGGGGKGYGVHTIRAGRTRVHGYETHHARHGVVVDFGSTETQVVRSTFERMNLATVDVHGEASYDTLVLGNTVRDSGQGLIVGGGGRAVHCNDGPRHHFLWNTIAGGSLTGLVVTDYSQDVSVRFNDIFDTATGVLIDAGSKRIALEGNRFRNALAAHVLVSGADTGIEDIALRDNLFDDSAPQVTVDDALVDQVEIQGSRAE